MPDRSETIGCEQILDHLEGYIDGDLEAGQRQLMATHLASCASCSAEHRLALAVQTGLRQLPELDTPPDLLENVLRQTEEYPTGRAKLLSWRPRTLSRNLTRRAPFRRDRSGRHRLAAAVLAAAVLAWGLLIETNRQPTVSRDPEPKAPTPSPTEIAQATEEARYALAYLARVSRRTGLDLKNDLLIDRLAKPTARGLARSLSASPSQGRDGGTTRERNRS